MIHDLDTLPSDVQALVRTERSRVAMPGDAQGRLAERLAASVVGFGPPPTPPPPAPPATLASKGALGAGVKALAGKWMVGLGLAALGAGAAGVAAARRDAVVVVSAPRRESFMKSATRGGVPPVVLEAVPTPAVSEVAPVSRPAASAPARPGAQLGSQASSLANLAEERDLLDTARAAIVRGDPAAALPALDRHGARFPQGVLAEERDALRVRALARLGRGDEARAALARLRQEHPHGVVVEGAAADVSAGAGSSTMP
jgi:hypothetical protein